MASLGGAGAMPSGCRQGGSSGSKSNVRAAPVANNGHHTTPVETIRPAHNAAEISCVDVGAAEAAETAACGRNIGISPAVDAPRQPETCPQQCLLDALEERHGPQPERQPSDMLVAESVRSEDYYNTAVTPRPAKQEPPQIDLDASDCETDPEMPDLVPAEVRSPVPSEGSSQTTLLGTPEEDSRESSPSSPALLGGWHEPKGGLGSCWGQSALRDALINMNGDGETTPTSDSTYSEGLRARDFKD